MSEYTPTPWAVSSAICGKHDTETVSIYHYPHDAACYEVVETGCKCGDEALTEANARHIVHCVNNHERLVEALRDTLAIAEYVNYYEGYSGMPQEYVEARALLATLESDKGGEL